MISDTSRSRAAPTIQNPTLSRSFHSCTMAPWAGTFLAKVHLKDIVLSMMDVLNSEGSLIAQDVATPLTNAVLLDLYMCALSSNKSTPGTLVSLLAGLGYISDTSPSTASTWYTAGKKLHSQCVSKRVKMPKGVKKDQLLSRLALASCKSLCLVTTLH